LFLLSFTSYSLIASLDTASHSIGNHRVSALAELLDLKHQLVFILAVLVETRQGSVLAQEVGLPIADAWRHNVTQLGSSLPHGKHVVADVNLQTSTLQ
jgi:hypothetical protein